MRDQFAPMIEGFDLNGIVDPYSFQCTPFYIEGDNGGTLMDGTTIHDILEEKVRLSWTFNALYLNQYISLSDALNSGESPDTVTAYAYDLTRNAVILAKFHASLPEFNFVSAYGQTMALANGELVLEEAELLAWFAVTPPNRTTFERGEQLDLTGFTVIQYDKDGNSTNITEQCTISTAEEVELLTEGDMTVPVIVTLPSGFELTFDWNITVIPPVPIASGEWWVLYGNGLINIYCVGDMPVSEFVFDYGDYLAPWHSKRLQITSAFLSNSVTSIARSAFWGCRNLTSITIPDGVTSIGIYAFQYCYSLTSITIPNSVTSIGSYAFSTCTNLTSITIPNGITGIYSNTFYGCNNLTSVMIPDSVISIENSAFAQCANLTSITIPNSVTSIGDRAFQNCNRLTSITIPDSVTSIKYGAFYECTHLSNVYYSGTKAQRNAISIGSYNANLTNATWHYNSTGPDS